jgi:DNA-binding transcriptional LysR family regulator
LERAQAIFSIVRTTEEDVRALSSLEQGVLRVGASTTVATYLLPPVLAAFHANYPGVDLRLTSQNTQVIVDRLRDYQLDVALVEGPVAEPWVSSEPWRDDELVVIASRQHALAPHPGRTKNTLERIAQETFLIREPGSGTREVAADALRRHGVTLGRTVELGSTEAIKQAVAAGLGISIVSRAALSDQLALGRLVILAVDGLEIRRTFNRLSVAGRAPSRSAQAFNALLDAPLVAR